jgi:hypothetical protein
MALMTAAPRITAEWQCTRCGTTNRKLVPEQAQEAKDKCVSCHQKHTLSRDARPVRWNARAG